MGVFPAEIDVEEDSLVGQHISLDPSYFTKAFELARQGMSITRTETHESSQGLSLTDKFEVVRHYGLGTFFSFDRTTEIGGTGVYLHNKLFEIPLAPDDKNKDSITIDGRLLDIKDADGNTHTLPISAFLLPERT